MQRPPSLWRSVRAVLSGRCAALERFVKRSRTASTVEVRAFSEAISYATDRDEVTRILLIVFQLTPQPRHEDAHVDAVVLGGELPHTVQQLIPAERPAGVAREQRYNFVFAHREV